MAKKGEFNIKELNFENKKQQAAAIQIIEIIKASGLSQREFAERMQVSLATLTNPLRPYFKKPPAKSLIRKIADQTDDPEETYNSLMKASGYEKELEAYPYKYSSAKVNNSNFLEVDIQRDIKSTISNLPISGGHRTEIRLNNRIVHDIVFDYKDTKAPVDEWIVDVCVDTRLPENIIKDYLYRIFKGGVPGDKVKFSLVTTLTGIFDEIASLDLSSVNLLISAILYDGTNFKEVYLNTAADHSGLDEVGLSL